MRTRRVAWTLLPASRPGERERERLAQVLHLCLGACAAPLHRGGAGGLTWTVPPGEPSPFSQRCLSRTSDAVLFKAPLVATAG